MQSESQKKATQNFERRAYDKVLLRIRKDGDLTRENIAQAAEACGMSLNAFILEAVREKIQNGSKCQ